MPGVWMIDDCVGLDCNFPVLCSPDFSLLPDLGLWLISCMWSIRKRIILGRAANQDLLSRELHMAGVVLSCGPKSEETWAYRSHFLSSLSFLLGSKSNFSGRREAIQSYFFKEDV